MASASGMGEDEVFDASKQAKAPTRYLSQAPRDAPAVRVGLVRRPPGVGGYGLFAARDLARDEFIFHEAPLMTARFNEKFAADPALIQSQVAACRAALLPSSSASSSVSSALLSRVTALAFPALAARFGIAPPDFEQVVAGAAEQEEDDDGDDRDGRSRGGSGCGKVNEDEAGDAVSGGGGGGGGGGSTTTSDGSLASELGRNLVPGHGRFAGLSVTREEYDAFMAGFRTAAAAAVAAGTTAGDADVRNACLDFFKAYAFQVQPTTGVGVGVGVGGSSGTGSGSSSLMMASGGAATREACVYLLGSLINHCCTPPPASSSSTTSSSFKAFFSVKSGSSKRRGGGGGARSEPGDEERGPNCSWRIGPSGLAHFVRPRHICVQARRPIRAGEQLTWDYGKREKGFECECDVCRESFMGGLGYLCGIR